MVNWTRENLALVAGIIEGEGYIECREKPYAYRVSRTLSIRVAMTDKDVIEKLRDLTGIGILSESKQLPNRKKVYLWSVGKREEAYALLVAIYQWLGIRRRGKIRNAIKIFKTWPRKFATVGAHLKILDPKKVYEILVELKKGRTGRSIAKDYGINEGSISCIKRGRIWKEAIHLAKIRIKKEEEQLSA